MEKLESPMYAGCCGTVIAEKWTQGGNVTRCPVCGKTGAKVMQQTWLLADRARRIDTAIDLIESMKKSLYTMKLTAYSPRATLEALTRVAHVLRQPFKQGEENVNDSIRHGRR